jgi:hypothetical protein
MEQNPESVASYAIVKLEIGFSEQPEILEEEGNGETDRRDF